jgi:hypothetical protein
MRGLSCSIAAALAAAVLVPAAAAQTGAPAARTGFSLTPYVGVLVPTTQLLAYNGQVTKLSAAVAFGGRVGIGLGSRIGIEGDVGYSPGSFDFSSSGPGVSTDVRVLTGSGRLTYYLIPRTSPLWLGVSGGVGAVRHSFKNSADGTPSQIQAGTDVGGVLGASAGIRIGPLLAIHVGAEDYLYSASFDVNGTKTSGRTQHDLRFTGGIRIPFVGF